MATVLLPVVAVKHFVLHIVAHIITARILGSKIHSSKGLAGSSPPARPRCWHPGRGHRPHRLARRPHGDVYILKKMARHNAPRTVRRFHQVIAGLTRVFTPQPIDKAERLGQLSGFDQKTRAIDIPFNRSHVHPPLGEGFQFWFQEQAVGWRNFSSRVNENLTAKRGRVNSQIMVQRDFSRNGRWRESSGARGAQKASWTRG